MIKIINQKLIEAIFKYDNYDPNDLIQYLTCENFEEKYHGYMYTNGEYLLLLLSIIRINR